MLPDFVRWVRSDVPTLRQVPPGLHIRFARITRLLCDAIFAAPSEEAALEAFLLFLAHHKLLLAAPLETLPARLRPRAQRLGRGEQQHALVARRLDRFELGQWALLLDDITERVHTTPRRRRASAPTSQQQRADRDLAGILQLVRSQEYRRAMQRLSSDGVVDGVPTEVAAALQEKFLEGDFPQAQGHDILWDPLPPPEPLLDNKIWLASLRGAPRKSGAGASGSRLEHWQVVLCDDRASEAVFRVADTIARGCLPGGRLGSAACAFLLGALTPLRKPDGGIRPIAVPEPLRRLVGRTLCRQYKDSFATALSPQQCAVGLEGGAEVMHKSVAAFAEAHPDYVFFKLDARNAYNSMHRRAAVDSLIEEFPELAGLVSLCYCRGDCRSRYVYRRDGRVMDIWSDAGVDQGDALAPVLFAFGMKRPAAAFLAALREQSILLAAGAPVLALLYLDDVVVAVPRSLVRQVLPLAQRAFGEGFEGTPGPGLHLRPDKSQAWSPRGERPQDLPPTVQWVPTGFVVVGAAHRDGDGGDGIALPVRPTGDEPIRHQWSDAVASAIALGEKVLPLVERVLEIGEAQKEAILNSAQCACLLLRYCVETKLAYLLRALPPDALGDLVEEASLRLQALFMRSISLPQALTQDQVCQLSLIRSPREVWVWGRCICAIMRRTSVVGHNAWKLYWLAYLITMLKYYGLRCREASAKIFPQVQWALPFDLQQRL